MLENPTAPVADPANVIKRYAPPNQRNRPLNRRKSGDRFDRTSNIYENNGEKNQPAPSKNYPIIDHGDAGVSFITNENARPGLIALEGCCRSEASQLLSDRWAAAMHHCSDMSIDSSERPVLYSGSNESAWRTVRLPHQMMNTMNPGGPSSGMQMDFLGELRRAMRNANANASSGN